jgi:hypothetical protein
MSNLQDLNRELFSLVDSFPRARWELMDYHFKSNLDGYLDVIQRAEGRKTLVFAETDADMLAAIRRLMLISDTIVFNVNTYLDKPVVSIFPIPDKDKSPVLGLTPVLDPGTGSYRVPRPVEVVSMLSMVDALAQKTDRKDTVLGYEWGRPDSAWQRSNFTRTSEPFRNERGEKCHIAVGLGYEYQSSTYDWLLGEARGALEGGHLAFAPFLRATPGTDAIDEQVQKAHLVQSILAVQGRTIRVSSGSVHPLTQLQVPYLENVPLDLLTRVLRDEGESLAAFRRVVDRALEDTSALADPSAIEKEMRRLKRDLFEDELDRVRRVCEKISRMEVFTAVGACVASVALSVAGVMGVGVPALVLAGATGLRTTVAEMVKLYEEEREIRQSPVYWTWAIGEQ